ncbi:hypothetical protein BMS3Bbin03_01195 [bacterium BMS3Bbin03]|nr:hypothetical protein BMS3Bbin03_01195 [bacterium BMS3Bbin03]
MITRFTIFVLIEQTLKNNYELGITNEKLFRDIYFDRKNL